MAGPGDSSLLHLFIIHDPAPMRPLSGHARAANAHLLPVLNNNRRPCSQLNTVMQSMPR